MNPHKVRNKFFPRVESLETRTLPAAGIREQYMLELVNRMRANPAAELPIFLADKDVQGALDFFKVDRTLLQTQWNQLTVAPPLAWSDQLGAAAKVHSDVMLKVDNVGHFFQGEEKDLGGRVQDAGYTFGALGENAFHAATTVFNAQAAWAIDWGFGPGGIQVGTGHRNNLMSTNFTDFGVGISDVTPGKRFGPLYMTQNFGRPLNGGNPFLLGVVYQDANKNGVYDQGEGVADVDVQIDGPGGNFTLKTSAAGYYQQQVAAGAYTVVASGGGLAAPQTRNATVGTVNVKQDVLVDAVNPAASVQFAQATYSVREGAGELKVKVVRAGDPAAAVTVPVTATEGSAKTPANFTLVTTNLAFAAGETEKEVSITIVNVPGPNGDLNFTLTLGAPTGGQLGAQATTAVTVRDDDPPAAGSKVSLDQTAYTVKEDAGRLTLKVKLDKVAAADVQVRVASSALTAVEGVDYTKLDTTVTIPAGQTEATFTLEVKPNANTKNDVTLTVRLSGPTGADLGTPGEATVTIQDVDAAAANRVQFAQPSYSVKENAGTLTVKATRTGDTTQPAVTDFTVTDGTAKNGTHFQILNPFFTFAANAGEATTDFQIVNTPGFTGPLTFTITLTAGAGGTPVGNPGTATITIEDVDPAPGGGGAGNQPPTAKDDLFVVRTGETSAVGTSLLSNDTDPENDPLTAKLATAATLGAATVNTDGTYRYAPGPTFWGVDTFTYQANDGKVDSNTAKVTVMTHAALQVRKVYQQVLGRAPDEGGWRYWTGLLTSGRAGLGAVASGIFESPERLDPIIVKFFKDFLGRDVPQNDGGVVFWRGVWQHDGGPDNVIAGLIDSQEFFDKAGGTNNGWSKALYDRYLRPEKKPVADNDGGVVFWTNELDKGLRDRRNVILYFVKSEENFRKSVQGWHQQYLGRAATKPEEDRFTAQLLGGATPRAVQIQLIDSAEYLNTPPPPAAGTASRL